MSLVAFQRAQHVSVEKQRTVVAGVKLAVDDDQHHPPFVIDLDNLLLASDMGTLILETPMSQSQQYRSSDKHRSYRLNCRLMSWPTKNRLFKNERPKFER